MFLKNNVFKSYMKKIWSSLQSAIFIELILYVLNWIAIAFSNMDSKITSLVFKTTHSLGIYFTERIFIPIGIIKGTPGWKFLSIIMVQIIIIFAIINIILKIKTRIIKKIK